MKDNIDKIEDSNCLTPTQCTAQGMNICASNQCCVEECPGPAGTCCPLGYNYNCVTGGCTQSGTCSAGLTRCGDGSCCSANCPNTSPGKTNETTCCPSGVSPDQSGNCPTSCPSGQTLCQDGSCCATNPCPVTNSQGLTACCKPGETANNGECSCAHTPCSNGECCAAGDCPASGSCCNPGETYNADGSCICSSKYQCDDNSCCNLDMCCGSPSQCPTNEYPSGNGNVIGYISSDSVAIYDMATNTNITSLSVSNAIKTLLHPKNGNLHVLSVDPAKGSGALTVFDSLNNILSTITCNNDMGDAVDMIMDSTGEYIYVLGAAKGFPNFVYNIDINQYTCKTHYFNNYLSGSAIAISAKDDYLYISSVNITGSSGLLVVYSIGYSATEMPTLKEISTIDTQSIVDIILTRDGNTAYVLENSLDEGNSQILQLDLSTPSQPTITNTISLPTGVYLYASGITLSADELYLYATVQEFSGEYPPYTENWLLHRVCLRFGQIVSTSYSTGNALTPDFKQKIKMNNNGEYLYVPATGALHSINLQDLSLVSLVTELAGVPTITITSPSGSTTMCCGGTIFDTTTGACCSPENPITPCPTTSGTCCGTDCCDSGDCCSDTTQTPSVPKGCKKSETDRCCNDGSVVASNACCPEDPPCGTDPTDDSASCCCGSTATGSYQAANTGICCNNTWYKTGDPFGLCCETDPNTNTYAWSSPNLVLNNTTTADLTCCGGKVHVKSGLGGICCGLLGADSQTWYENTSEGTQGVCCGTPPPGTNIPPNWIPGGDCCDDSDCTDSDFPSCISNRCHGCCGDVINNCNVCCPDTGKKACEVFESGKTYCGCCGCHS